MRSHLCGMGTQPAVARGAFTVLFGMPILRHDVLRGQGNDLGLARADDHWCDGGVLREGVAIGELTGETVGAMNGLGRKVIGTIQGHQQLVAQDPKMCQHAVLFQALKDLNKDRIKMAWRERVEPRAHLIVTGHLLYTPQRLGMIAPCGVVQPALILQK
jgi:hypothetical protein